VAIQNQRDRQGCLFSDSLATSLSPMYDLQPHANLVRTNENCMSRVLWASFKFVRRLRLRWTRA